MKFLALLLLCVTAPMTTTHSVPRSPLRSCQP
jgi:hypothetical protein